MLASNSDLCIENTSCGGDSLPQDLVQVFLGSPHKGCAIGTSGLEFSVEEMIECFAKEKIGAAVLGRFAGPSGVCVLFKDLAVFR